MSATRLPVTPHAVRVVDRPFRRQLFVNTAMTTAGNVWSIVVSAIALPIMIRGLGSQAFGLWVLVQTFSAFTGWLALVDLGMGTAATRFIAARMAVGDNAGASSCVATTMAIFAGTGAAAALLFAVVGRLLFPLAFHVPMDLRDPMRIVVLLFACQVLADFVTRGAEFCLEGLNRVDLSRAVEMFRRTTTVLIVAAVALARSSITSVALASVLASIPATVLGVAVLRRHMPSPWGRANRGDLSTLFTYGREVAMLRPIGVIHRTMDRVIVGAVLGPVSVSLVEVATQVQGGADAVLSASTYSVTPTSSWLDARGDRRKLADLVLRGTRLSALVTLPFVVLPALLAPELVRTWIGPGQRDAAGLIVVALAYVAVTAPAQVGSNLMVGVGHARAVLWPALAAVVVNLVASLLLVHVVGVVGVFLGTLIAAPFLVIPLMRSTLHRVGVMPGEFVRRSLMPLVAPGAILVAAVAAVKLVNMSDAATIATAAGVGLIAYGLGFARFGLEPVDRRSVVNATRSRLAARRG